ncbi:MAG: MFS transporter [Alistipes sp.]|nr:MFS transporter [Candidatus Alistipes equi]
MDRKRRILIGAVVVALIIAVSGIGKFHASPFSLCLKIENPMAWGTSPSKVPVAVADQSGTVLLILNENGRLRHAVKVKNADHQYDLITQLYAENGSIYANVVTAENQHIVREQIRIYNKRGHYVRTIFDESYTEKTVFSPRNQLFVADKDGLSVVRIENKELKMIGLYGEKPKLTDSLCLDKKLIAVRRGTDSVLYVSGLYGMIDEYVPGSGVARPVRLDDDTYINSLKEESFQATSIDYSLVYIIGNILFWLSISFLLVTGLFLIVKFSRRGYNSMVWAVAAVVMLVIVIVGFYSYHISRQTKNQLTQMMVYHTDLLAQVTGDNYMELVQTLSADTSGNCLVRPVVLKQLENLHTTLAKSSRFDGNEYYVGIVYRRDSIARQLVDNMNLSSTGQPANLPVPEWEAPTTDSTFVLTAFNEKLQYAAHNVTDQTGKIVAKVISLFPENLLQSVQKQKAINLFLSLLSILIGIYTLFTFINTIRHSISEYIQRRRKSLPYAKEHLFPTLHSLIIWFREVDRSLMVFIIPYFTGGGSILDVASISAIVLTVYSLGSILMVPFTKLAYNRVGPRAVGVSAAVVNLFSYILMVIALKSTEVNLFYVAKFLSGASAGNVLTVVSNSLGASVEDKDARRRLFDDKQTVGNTVNVLAVLLSGYIIQYLNPIVLYVIAIMLSVMVIVLCAITLSGLSSMVSREQDSTPRLRDIVTSFKFFAKRDGISLVWFVLLPMALLFGYLDFIYPLYASECGMSPLMLSNIMIIGLALNLLLRKPLNNYYASIGTKRSLVVQSGIISASLLMLVFSPNIIWMTFICFAIYILKMNSYVILYQVEVIERNGFKQQEVQSDCLLADQILRTVRMPFVNFLVQAGRISAGMWIGLICAFLTGGLALFDRNKK